jgi:hypothetical protein
MNVSQHLTLHKRVDDLSYQVSAEQDHRFWFRLERHEDRDVITDYLIGSTPREEAGAALLACYELLGLAPKSVIVFRDILPARHADADRACLAKSLAEAQGLYAGCGRSVLTKFGASQVEERLEKRREKYDLVVEDIAH